MKSFMNLVFTGQSLCMMDNTVRNVKDEIDKLEEQFEDLRDATLSSLVDKAENNERLFHRFRTRLALLSGSRKQRHVRFFTSKNIARILKSKSFEEIFAILGDYWTFLNCSLLLYIIKTFTGGAVDVQMQSYESHFNVFCCETTVAELSKVWGGNATPDSIEISATSHRHDWQSLTVKEAMSYSEDLAYKATLQPFVFSFIAGSPGSVILTWSLPRHLAPLFAHLLDSAFLDEQGIDSLQIDGVTFQEFRSNHPVVRTTNQVGFILFYSHRIDIPCSK